MADAKRVRTKSVLCPGGREFLVLEVGSLLKRSKERRGSSSCSFGGSQYLLDTHGRTSEEESGCKSGAEPQRRMRMKTAQSMG